MKKMLIFLFSVAAILGFENCEKSPPEPDPELLTYTWKGVLYKGLGEEVWANTPVTLLAEERKLSGFSFSTLASGTTDAQGRFELTYELAEVVPWETRDDNYNCESMTLRANGLDIKEAPCGVDVEREFCSNDHCEVLLRIRLDNPIPEGDSIFMNLKPINAQPGIKAVGNNVQAIIGPVSNGDEYQFKVGITSCYNYCGSGINMMWGKDSIQENQHNFSLTGFPYVDTIDLKF